ncbi:MAG TPA: universal stress protein [Burkholderiales bacterium]|nr:universal stress protein [Burkholderiales bacterium]
MFKHILVSTDGSRLSDKAVAMAVGIASETGARLTAYHATDPFPAMVYPEYAAVLDSLRSDEWAELQEKRSQRILEKCRTRAAKAGVKCQTISGSPLNPFEGILAAARKSGCDLIVMASHGRRGIKALVLGSETGKVLTHSKIPVLVCR